MKQIFFTLIFCFCSICGFSQVYVDNKGNVYDNRKSNKMQTVKNVDTEKKSSFDISKLSLGGSFSLQFGDYTVIGLSPQVGYDFSKYFTAGAGFGYTYYKYNSYSNSWNSSYLSFNTFGRFYPTDYIVLSVQPEISRMWQTLKYNDGTEYKESEFVPSFLVGGGLRLSNIIAMIQYDVVQDKNSPYGSNIFYSVGYTFRF